jgi:hypothetical protein
MTAKKPKKQYLKIARKILKAIDDERKEYEDIEMRGGNSFEYGRRTQDRIIADELKKLF